MTQFHVGEVIRELRQQRGVTQAQLCVGICELATLSKIENEKQQPRRATLTLLLQRLGVAEEQYHGLCGFDDLALEELKLAIRNANARFDYRGALELLDKLMTKYDYSSSIMEQFVLWTQAINGRLIDGEVVQYPLDERLMLLNNAIKCTVPNLDIEDISQSLLGLDEVKIIMGIANVYCNMEKYVDAVDIYRQLLPYIEQHCMDFSEKPSLVALVTYNYSKALGMLERNTEELLVVDVGLNYCINSGFSRRLGDLLLNKSCTLKSLGKHSESKELAIQAYYTTKATGMFDRAEAIKSYLYDEFSWSPSN